MSENTFDNLKPEKKEKFITAALKEFASHDFQTASVTKIVKELGIAKGSVYQYFNSKLDLWLYLKKYSEEVKLRYITKLNRSDFPDFWTYYKAMFISGIDFDLEEPLCSLFLYRIGFKESGVETSVYVNSWKQQAHQMFCSLVNAEKKNGAFDKKVSTEMAAHFMVTVSMSIAELLQSKYAVDFEKNIKQGKPIFGANKKELIKAVDDLITLLQKALK